MAHIDIANSRIKPQLSIAAQRQQDVGRAKYMLVAMVIAATMILVVATLFMTMF